ncbi:MAG: glycosyltransferase [Nitriliruptoraceae bacterium]
MSGWLDAAATGTLPADPLLAASSPDDVGVVVIVVNHNTGDLLPACLAAYQAQDHPHVTIVVVDNASTDGSAEVLDTLETTAEDWPHPTRFIRNDDNRGFCGGINDGLRASTEPVVVFSNVDVEPSPDLVRRAVEALLADPRRGTVQPKLLRPPYGHHGPVIDSTGHVIDRARLVVNRGEGSSPQQWIRPEEVFGASGALVAHRRAMLADIAWQHGGDGHVLTEDLFAFFDDVELDWRARRMGWSAWFEPAAVAVHERGGVGARRTARVEALNFANRLLVVITCDDLRALAVRSPLVAATTLLKAAELLLTRPTAFVDGVTKVVRGLPGALRRRRELRARQRVTAREVVRSWMQPFDGRQWVATWWGRTRRAASRR